VITLSGSDSKPNRRNFIWIEGKINVLNIENGIYANQLSYVVFNNIKTSHTSSTTIGNDIVINNSKKIALSHIETSDYSNCGISIAQSSNITFSNNTCQVSRIP